ncbi:nitrile hydratase accessory protein [Natronorubrum sp. FCH18a]|uniref:nitrile hydratase accessory protein n=1 Tax=Natronorubrum sp. FCH18a TaxID=3447018 RepID=UPI003F50EEB3
MTEERERERERAPTDTASPKASSTPDAPPVECDSPDQLRAFGLVVALSETEAIEWDAFQRRLIERIGTDDGSLETDTERAYYDHWIDATAQLLSDAELLDEDELEERAAEFARGDRDASEFVVGDHSHDH